MAYERAHRFLRQGDRILAAVSGGPDSVCLAHYLASQKKKKGFFLALLHVNHGLRGKDAEHDAEFVRRLGESLDVPVKAIKVPVTARSRLRRKGIEDAARELRYKAIKLAASQLQCNKAATAHQLDDQAETVLLHLLRGTKLAALGGIPPQRPLAKGLVLIRPLLPLKKLEVLNYLRIHGLAYRIDRSNRSLRFTRNWMRLKILPALEKRQPRVREHLAGIAEQVQKL
ncbi:MAG: tRNA lysidine(34) synthetase TilS [Elusimicrobia bacterium RIFCSPHIGHO2_02_FULL_57_9]|nr:MAG: tRNA lysidine(34) synthetase TilS [Elusimicrobia bacterium RIFCSPHIGHO2_02_FULL_57_9]